MPVVPVSDLDLPRRQPVEQTIWRTKLISRSAYSATYGGERQFLRGGGFVSRPVDGIAAGQFRWGRGLALQHVEDDLRQRTAGLCCWELAVGRGAWTTAKSLGCPLRCFPDVRRRPFSGLGGRHGLTQGALGDLGDRDAAGEGLLYQIAWQFEERLRQRRVSVRRPGAA